MKRVSVNLLLGAVAGSMAFAAPVSAKNIVADVPQIADVMKRNGYTVEVRTDKHGTHIRSSRGKDTYSFSIFFYGCAEGTMNDCKSVQFFSAFNPKTKPTLAALNGYARDNRWGRIYQDKENDPVIEMDVDLEKGGMSEALFLDNLEYFEAVVDKFGEFVFTGKAD